MRKIIPNFNKFPQPPSERNLVRYDKNHTRIERDKRGIVRIIRRELKVERGKVYPRCSTREMERNKRKYCK